MQSFGYPTWCLEYVDDGGVYDIVKKFIALVQSDGKITHNIAIEIGKISSMLWEIASIKPLWMS